VAYNGIRLQATIYLGNLYGGYVTRAVLAGEGGEEVELAPSFDPRRPNRVQVLLPAGLAPGRYAVALYDEVGCPGTTEDLLRVTDRLQIAVASIDPPFGWTSAATAVAVAAQQPPLAGQVQFVSTPRVYVNPNQAGAEDRAAELRGVTFHSAAELHGIVDAGLPPRLYDIVVVNPDGGVGLLSGAFRVTAAPPPIVDTVSPGSWQNSAEQLSVTVRGSSFDPASVVVQCRLPGGGQYVEPRVTIVASGWRSLELTVDTRSIAHMSVCVMRVTNRDTAYADYSPITVTNSAGKFVEFAAGPSMGVARRAPAVFSGMPSRTARFLYAVGGDDGSPARGFTSGELSPLDRFGTPGAWQPLPAVNALTTGRSLLKAVRFEDFVYLVGGADAADGGRASGAILRARILESSTRWRCPASIRWTSPSTGRTCRGWRRGSTTTGSPPCSPRATRPTREGGR